MSKRVFKTELDAVNNSLQVQVNNSISKNIVDAKGDIVTASAADTPIRLAVGTNEQRLVVDSATTSGLKYVADTTNYAVGAKGDLLAGTAADTVSALTVGANGETLVANSSASVGLSWQGSAIGKNATINGGCEIAQRGTSAVTLTAASFLYPVDRFFVGRSSGTTGATAQQISSTGLDGFQNAVRIQRTAGNTATNDLYIGQSFETANSIPFANKTIVFSFWARAGANYSPTSSALNVRFYTGTGTDQAGLGSAFTGSATPISQTATLTTSWQRFQYSATLASTATQMQFLLFATPTGTAGAADSFDVTGFQVELGSVATPFSRAANTLAGELAACQRYYWRFAETSGTADWMIGSGTGSTATTAFITVKPPVSMRKAPTSFDYSGLDVLDGTNARIAVSSLTNSNSSANLIGVIVTVASGITQYRPYFMGQNDNSTGYFGASAEL